MHLCWSAAYSHEDAWVLLGAVAAAADWEGIRCRECLSDQIDKVWSFVWPSEQDAPTEFVFLFLVMEMVVGTIGRLGESKQASCRAK